MTDHYKVRCGGGGCLTSVSEFYRTSSSEMLLYLHLKIFLALRISNNHGKIRFKIHPSGLMGTSLTSSVLKQLGSISGTCILTSPLRSEYLKQLKLTRISVGGQRRFRSHFFDGFLFIITYFLSLQDLKDYFRAAGEVTFTKANREKMNEGYVYCVLTDELI